MFFSAYATADTVSRLMEQPVVVAFDAGNLADVAAGLRKQWPDRKLLIAADNDHLKAGEIMPNGKPRPNVGLEKAEEAARLHNGQLLTPPFAQGERGSDWNDYARLHRDTSARRSLQMQMMRGKQERRQEIDTARRSRVPQQTAQRERSAVLEIGF